MNYKIATAPGDGIGPEVTKQALNAVDAVGERFGHKFDYTELIVGGAAYERHGNPFPDETLSKCRECDAILLGAVGGPAWDTLPPELRPERALFALRKGLGLYANVRPSSLFSSLRGASPLREDIAARGFDMVIVRELTGGLYFGEKYRKESPDGETAVDTMSYSVTEIERVGRRAFELARLRRRSVISVDKANVLETSRLWRETMNRLASDYPDVSYSDMLVDNAAMQLVKNPAQFDVLVTENMFGDILSDEAGQISGSIGMLASLSMGDGKMGLFEPAHGSAPDIAGKNLANPLAAVMSAAMMLRYSLELPEEASLVEAAVNAVLEDGLRTPDLYGGSVTVGTEEMGAAVCGKIKSLPLPL